MIETMDPSTYQESVDKHVVRIFNHFMKGIRMIDEVKGDLGNTQSIRRQTFPEFISENMIVKILTELGDASVERIKGGDVRSSKYGRVEYKTITKGPMSFSPKSQWDALLILVPPPNADGEFTLFKAPASDRVLSNVFVNKTDTFETKCRAGVRPRITFEKLCEQMRDDIHVIFRGRFAEVYKNVIVDNRDDDSQFALQASLQLEMKQHFPPMYNISHRKVKWE